MEKDLNYWKKNAEEDYMKVPISVLRYITELENAVLPQADVSGSGLSKVKKGTGWYMLVSTILSGGVMFCIGQMFGTDGAIMAGILLLIAMASAVRYNV